MVRKPNAKLSYHVVVTRRDESHAVAETRGHQVTLNIQKGAGRAGFNAAETLLAALGTCLLTNVNSLGEKMHLDIHSARLEFDAIRRDEPPVLTRIDYRLILDSSEPLAKLEELHELCFKWGTVTNTVSDGLVPHGELVIEPSKEET